MRCENGDLEGLIVNRTVVPPRRRPNRAIRSREHLTAAEVDQLRLAALERGRHGLRDATMILMAFRHGLRVSELVNLRWQQIDLAAGTIHVNRLKRGNPATHELSRTEIRALRQLDPGTGFVFLNERGTVVTVAGFSKMLKRTARSIGFPIEVHPHMLRHACGYKLANDGRDTRVIQDYLGHRNIQHTVTYTRLSAERFRGLWEE